MPDQDQLGEFLPAADQITQYERKLKSEWRSLLQEDSKARPERRPDKSSYLFRPRASTALDLDIDPDTLVRKAGDTLGDFKLERLIGQGAMGQVWEALQVSLQRQVAIKLIRPDRVTPELLRYFRREGRAGGRLQHPGIVAVYAMGQTEGVHWIAQELVEGECTFHDFLQELKSHDDMPGDYDRRIALFFYQLAEALHFAHEAGVIHRDLKPQNVLVAEGDRPKVSDFGVARILDEGTLTQEGGIQGTPRYMSPEQVLGISANIGPASDQFSLGVMLYKALTLKDAVEGDTLHAVLHSVTKGSPSKPTRIRPQLSRDLEAVVMKSIEKLPQDRYASLLEFQQDLGNYLDGRATNARQVRAGERALKWVRRNPVPTSVVAILLVLAGAIALLAGALGDSREQTTLEEWRVHVLEGRSHLERGEPSLAMSSFLSAATLRPNAPETPILLASIATRRARYREAESHLVQAEELGFEPADAESTDAREQYLRGLYLFARGRQPRYEEAATALTRAFELDGSLRDVWYPVYQIRAAQSRHAEAATALREYMKGLTIGDPQAMIASALLAEQKSQLEEAQLALETLSNELADDPESPRQFEICRARGRIALKQGRFEAAVEALSTAVAIEDEDSDSQRNLAESALMMAKRVAKADREPWLEIAEAAARSASETEYDKTVPLFCLAEIEYMRGAREGGPARAAFRSHAPNDKRLLLMDARPTIKRGKDLWASHKYEAAVREFRSVIELGLEDLTCLTLVANDLSFALTTEADREAQDLLDRAFKSWIETRSTATALDYMGADEIKQNMVQSMLVTRYVVSARQSVIGTAEETKDALESYLLEAPFHSDAEKLTYAEALVHDAPEELIDRERARELLDEFLAGSSRIPESALEQYEATIRNIEAGLE